MTVQVPSKKKPAVKIAQKSSQTSVPPSKPQLPSGDRHTLLATACGATDTKCICINHAIFKHDSGWATANNRDGSPSVGKRALNPCNMRPPKTWKPSVPFTIMPTIQNGETTYFAKFKTLEDGVTACVELYKRNYSTLPPDTLVSRWTAGGGKGAYQSAVNSCFI